MSLDGVTAIAGPSRYWWVGFETCFSRNPPRSLLATEAADRRGFISVLDVAASPWRVIKRWEAHKGRIERLFVDPASVWSVGLSTSHWGHPDLTARLSTKASTLRVVSSGRDCAIQFWDGLLRRDWMSESYTG